MRISFHQEEKVLVLGQEQATNSSLLNQQKHQVVWFTIIIHASEPLPGTLQIHVPVCINIKDRVHNLFKQEAHRSDGHWSTVALRLTCQRASCLYFKHHLKNVNNWSCRSDINVLNKNFNIALQDIKKLKSIAIRKINFYITCFYMFCILVSYC